MGKMFFMVWWEMARRQNKYVGTNAVPSVQTGFNEESLFSKLLIERLRVVYQDYFLRKN
jgi:hypothetical protein